MTSNLDKLREDLEEQISNLENIKKSISRSLWSGSDEQSMLIITRGKLYQHKKDREAILKDILEQERHSKNLNDRVSLEWIKQLLKGGDDE